MFKSLAMETLRVDDLRAGDRRVCTAAAIHLILSLIHVEIPEEESAQRTKFTAIKPPRRGRFNARLADWSHHSLASIRRRHMQYE